MKQKLLLSLLALLLSLGAWADYEGTCGDNLTWTYVTATNTLTISGNGEMYNYNANNVPWSFFRSSIQTIIINNGVTSIGNSAFYECNNLTSVTLPNSVTKIDEYAFSGCSGLTSITIPNSVTFIGSAAFYGCRGITSLTIPNSVTFIGSAAFIYCRGITSLTIPNSVKSINNQAFYGCSSLTSVTIPNSVTYIDYGAFDACYGLTSLVIGSGVTSIGRDAFNSTNLKKTIWLTNTPPSGASEASKTMNYVSNDQFKFSNQVVYPFLSSYFDVDGIRYVPVSPSERSCDAIDCTYDNSITNITIPSSVTNQGITLSVQKVQPYVCYANKYIENLTCNINSDIPDYAFTGCSNMKNVTLGDNITSIGNYAFQDCSSLLSVVVPNAVTTLGNYSFSSCKLISSFSIPKSVTKIGNYAFSYCSGLKDVKIEDRTEELTLGSNGSSPLFSGCPLDNVYIGGDISYQTGSSSGYSPFYRNTSLRTVVITDKETEISANEFYGCTNLQSFTVGDGVEKFGDWAFSGCQSLKSLSFGSHLKTIGKEAFSDCTSVTEITSKAATPPACRNQALDDINKWNCKLYVPQGSMSAYQVADQWKEFFFIAEGEGGGTPVNPDSKKCAMPIISYSNGKLTFNSATDGAVCQSTITDSDIASYSSNEVQLGVTYNISVYATKDGYENSDVATATLCWIDVEPRTEGIANGVASVRANAVLIQGESGTFSISGADEGTPISIYNTAGQMVGSAKANAETTHVFTTLRKGEIGIVKIGQKAVKVVVK